MLLLPARQQARAWGAQRGGILVLRCPLTASLPAPVAAAGAVSRLRRSLALMRSSAVDLTSSVAAVRCASTNAFDPTQMATGPDAADPHPITDAAEDFAATPSPDTATSAEARRAATNAPSSAYAPWEVRAVVLPLLPPAPPGTTAAAHTTRDAAVFMTATSKLPKALEAQLPKVLRAFLAHEEKSAAAASGSAPPPTAPPPSAASAVTEKKGDGAAAAQALLVPMVSYMLRQFPNDVALLSSGHLVRLQAAAAHTDTTTTSAADPAAPEGPPAFPASSSSPLGAASLDTPPPPRPSSAPSSAAAAGAAAHVDTTAPPPPPQPQSGAARHGAADSASSTPSRSSYTNSTHADTAAPAAAAAGVGGGTAPHGDGAARWAADSTSAHPPPPPPVPSAGPGTAGLGPSASSPPDGGKAPLAPQLRTAPQVMDVLAPYIPTFFVHIDAVEPTIPSEIQQLYADSTFRHFLKRFRHYIDLRAAYNSVEVRLQGDFDHPQRGAADARFSVGGMMAGAGADGMALRRPPRNSEANLIGYIAPQVPKEYTPLANVLQELAPLISRHPAFDARLGVMGLLGKYPEYFQVAQNKLRARPYGVAPNALDELDETTSVFPDVFHRVMECVTAAAHGKNFAVAEEKAAAAVSTGRLYGLLTTAEKSAIKVKCRSFPTFLRLHGKCIVVSVDKMKVHLFQPPYEACVETLADERLRMSALRPDDPVLQIPAEMPAESNAEWAVRQLYDALPLMQCAELDEVLSLVPPAVRDALPRDVAEVQTVLQQFPDYFSTWRYPDDETVIVIQRARVEAPALEKADVVRMVLPLIPQGGTTLSSLRTRVPLVLQRYFYHHGTVATLSAMTDVFAISGDRIVRMA